VFRPELTLARIPRIRATLALCVGLTLVASGEATEWQTYLVACTRSLADRMYADAVRSCEALAAENPPLEVLVEASFDLGRAYQELGRFDEAMIAFRKAADLVRGHPGIAIDYAYDVSSQWRISEILFARRDYVGALAALRRTEGDLPGSCMPDRPNYRYDMNVAILYEYLGQYRKAVGAYLMAARWLPHARAPVRLFELYEAAGRQRDLSTLVRSDGRRDPVRERSGGGRASIVRRGDCWGIARLDTVIDRISEIRAFEKSHHPDALAEILDPGADERERRDDDPLLLLFYAFDLARSERTRVADELLKPLIKRSRSVLLAEVEPEPVEPSMVLFPLPPIPKRLALPRSCECLYPSKSGYACR
jgi:tetratricopeptide (TPR) repeat protein